MKFDCQNLQISLICSGNPLNISFHLFDMKYFQRKLMISGKSPNTSFHLFDWMYFQRKLMISGHSFKLTNGNEILPIKLHFILFGWNTMKQISMFVWTHFQRKLMFSGNSYKLINEMKFFQSNFISLCLVGIQ